jgi:hypothetical protein
MDDFTQRIRRSVDSLGSYNAPYQLLTLWLPPNKSLDRSGGSVFRIKLGAAKGE